MPLPLFDPAKMGLSTFGWTAETARQSVYGYRGQGRRSKIGPQYQTRFVQPASFPLRQSWANDLRYDDEEIRRALPEAKA